MLILGLKGIKNDNQSFHCLARFTKQNREYLVNKASLNILTLKAWVFCIKV